MRNAFLLPVLLLATSGEALSGPVYQGSGVDAVGDANNSSVAPLGYGDLVSVDAMMNGSGGLRFRVRFAPGTIDSVHGFVELDIDNTPDDVNSPNVDYFVQLSGSAGSNYKRICQVTPTICYGPPQFSWDTDELMISMLASDIQSNGDFSFRVRSFYYVGDSTSTGLLDVMPDGDDWIRMHPVPEPSTLALVLCAGVLATSVRTRRRGIGSLQDERAAASDGLTP